jgi:hypothetical protein
VNWLFIGFKKACDLVRRKYLYNISIEFGIPMKLVRIIKCVNETCNRIRVSKYLSDMFHIKKWFARRSLSPLLFNFASEYAIRRV